MFSKLFALSLLASSCLATVIPPLAKRAADVGYENPAAHNGSMLASNRQFDDGDRYPLNVIVSNFSTPSVLTDNGVKGWIRSLDYYQADYDYTVLLANTGDGRGFNRQFLAVDFNSDYAIDYVYLWQQSSTSAYFLSASRTIRVSKTGVLYSPDAARVKVVEQATIGNTFYNGITYTTTCQDVKGLYPYGPNLYTDAKCAVCTIIAANST